jgi:NADPH:quinone reductase-like Zn-dependent oxidoreductase/acyl carrier protein
VRRKPPHLSFEQAATVPVAFMTAFYALHTLGGLQRGERVLIHSGTGGVGLAAVQLALRAGAVVFASAGSPEKRELLSLLGVHHVLDSRSLAFADEILDLTEGKGVDLVLNSLAGEAIDKSLSILRSYGRFIEIGKVDIYQNRRIGMRPLRKNISMFAVDLSGMLEQRPELAHSLLHQVLELLEQHELRPLPHLVFPVGRIADAFRHMAQAKHVGKLIVSMQDIEGLKVEQAPRAVSLEADASYLITGGLGGLGLAVAARLARHGARHLALVGRSAPSSRALAAVERLRQRGVDVATYQADIADRAQVERIIVDIRRELGPLRGIIHAAMVLDDAPIEGLTEEQMWTAMAPKLAGAWNLHLLTAGLRLDFFVLFSSFASVLGSPGQANYVAGNAFLEALAHYRRAQGLPALTVSWGRIGDIGHVATNHETSDRLTRLGILPIPAADMLDLLDELMSVDAVEVGAARIDWEQVSRAMGARVPGRFASLSGVSGAQDGRSISTSGARAVLDADDATLPSALETYLRDQLARAMGASPARIDMQRPLVSLGIDSLIAVDVRNRISADLGINLPISAFMQGASVGSLASFVIERFRESDRGKRREVVQSRS